jgi:hypothetical protein
VQSTLHLCCARMPMHGKRSERGLCKEQLGGIMKSLDDDTVSFSAQALAKQKLSGQVTKARG